MYLSEIKNTDLGLNFVIIEFFHERARYALVLYLITLRVFVEIKSVIFKFYGGNVSTLLPYAFDVFD